MKENQSKITNTKQRKYAKVKKEKNTAVLSKCSIYGFFFFGGGENGGKTKNNNSKKINKFPVRC